MSDGATAGGRLLVFDDDEAVARTLAALAGRLGVAVHTANGADDFFATLEHWRPTHIAIDLVMPEVDGIEVMRLLAVRGCSAAVIIMSGVGARVLDAARRSATEHGLPIVGVLPKPFSQAQLRALLVAVGPESATATGDGRSRWTVDPAELASAIEGRRLTLVYQPKIDCASRRVVGFEALVRWNHPDHGTILPDRFISLAERSGLIESLTDEVVRMACDWLGSCPAHAGHDLAVNISATSLGDVGLADRLLKTARSAGVDPHRIILEITETGAMSDPTTVLDTLTRCRMKGFRLAIDDFGVGYSSLVQLARLPFSEMKIDRSFVMKAATSAESQTIIRAVIRLGTSLGLSVTAEGVEDAQTLQRLVDEGCHHVQGYLIAPPMPPERLSGWMADWEARAGGAFE